jgi:hypothetical protein
VRKALRHDHPVAHGGTKRESVPGGTRITYDVTTGTVPLGTKLPTSPTIFT